VVRLLEVPEVLPAARQALRQQVERTLGSGHRRNPRADQRWRQTFEEPPGDPGLFGPGSVTWQVHGDLPAMLVGGVAALLLQTLHPLAMAGVVDHSAYRTDPLGRLRRTAEFVGATTFGSTPAAEQAISAVRAVHRRVRGVAPDGRPYDAQDPALITWVHAAETWCFLRAYQRYGPRPLPDRRADRYLAEMAVVAERLGAPGAPASLAELRAYLTAMRPDLVGGAQARSGAAFIISVGGQSLPPPSPPLALVQAVLVQGAMDLLPRWAVRMLGLREPLLAERLALRAIADALLGTVRLALGPSPALLAAEARCRAGAPDGPQASAGGQRSEGPARPARSSPRA
jgi:uncharacterized protein (DUF2236 family)